jgi:glycosyltransferase involved in cell wall biosynthesis
MTASALTVALDLRPLVDPNYRDRGVGRLSANLVASAPAHVPAELTVRFLGILDPGQADRLAPAVAAVLSGVVPTGQAARRAGARALLTLSPMTHDPLTTLALVADPAVHAAAVVYDFIPLAEPDRYLPSAALRYGYQAQLAALAGYRLYFPISRATAGELADRLAVPEDRIETIGAPINALIPQARRPVRDIVLFVGGGDPRKRAEDAVRGHAASRGAAARGLPLHLVGGYGPDDRARLTALHRAAGGGAEAPVFHDHLSDAAVAALYGRAAAVLAPSAAEGFSLPVAEGMAAGAPVIASDIPAHRELVPDAAALAPVGDVGALAARLDRALGDAGWAAAVVAGQETRWPAFLPEAQALTVWRRFFAGLPRRPAPGAGPVAAPVAAPGTLTGARPRIALLSPAPPARSGVADYSAATARALARIAAVDLFSPAPADPIEGVRRCGPVSAAPFFAGPYDATVCVTGNSHHHVEIVDVLLRHGGACIQHDNRMLGFYRILHGEARARAVAEAELGRPLGPGEMDGWLADEATLPATLLGEIARAAAPMIVHSRVTERLVAERFGVRARYLPFSIYNDRAPDAARPGRREQARRSLGYPDGEIVVASFGHVDRSKAPLDCVWAIEILRAWGYRARLAFVGEAPPDQRAAIAALAAELGVADAVSLGPDYLTPERYAEHLAAADAAIQLRTHRLGGLSGALLDCIAAGLPTVANADLAEAMEAPAYVARVPDAISPVLVAEALAGLIDGGAAGREALRAAYCAPRRFATYAAGLLAALDLAPAEPVR